MSDKFGPNGAQVRQFIRRVKSLGLAEWALVPDDAAIAKAAHDRLGAHQIEAIVEHTHGQEDWINAPLGEFMKTRESLDNPNLGSISDAIVALALCKELTYSEFAARYGGFHRVIPVETLGPGFAPTISSLPVTVPERFVTRVRALHGPDWGQATVLAYATECALGVEAIGAALDAAGAAAADVDQVMLTAVLDGLEEELPFLRVARDITRALLKRVGREETGDGFSDQQAQYRKIALRAALALLAEDSITEAQFWTLYLPFAGLIPPETLDSDSRLWGVRERDRAGEQGRLE